MSPAPDRAPAAAPVAAAPVPPALSPEQSLAVSRAQIAAALQQPMGMLLLQRLLGPKRAPNA